MPRRWSEAPPAPLSAVRGLLTDIDDTLTRDGWIEPAALQALHRAHDAGLALIAITGRPTGWCVPAIREWPLDAAVAENGAVMLRRVGSTPGAAAPIRLDHLRDEAGRADDMRRLEDAWRQVRLAHPEARRATDSAGRLTDLAIDHAEHHRLDAPQVDAIAALLRGHGLTVTVSSIHINAWVGQHDKWSGARWAVETVTGAPLRPADWAFVGDSANDQALFAQLPLSVGVANIAPLLARLQHPPAYLAEGERGVGFAEVVDRLLAARTR